jgi:hypothetical protein
MHLMLLATGCAGLQMTKIFSLLWIIMDNIVKKVKLYQMKGQTTWNEGTEAAYRS